MICQKRKIKNDFSAIKDDVINHILTNAVTRSSRYMIAADDMFYVLKQTYAVEEPEESEFENFFYEIVEELVLGCQLEGEYSTRVGICIRTYQI